ncbi:MAG: VWA domain-containing protein [Acidobacteriota bacterium]|nr:VWA domain-containing protein [Acidobacteriota bacterium]
MYSLRRVFAAALFPTLVAFSCFAQTNSSNTFEGVQVELPAGGHLRIENQYGEVATEVWKEKYVSVTATIEGTRPLARSPVVIANRNQLLAISIVRRLTEPAAAVKLAIKIPETAHVEIVTGTGQISMRGIPSSAAVRSVAGPVTVEFLGAANADIAARSAKGVVKSELPQLLSENGHVLQARLGTGEQTLRINTETGDVTLLLTNAGAVAETASTKARDLPAAEGPAKAAGIPAPALDTQEVSEGDIIRVDSQLVTLNMSVIDRNTNRGLAGLGKSDFRLFENGTEQQILQFESSSAPFDLLLLIDLSGSTRDVVKLIRSAALRFVDAARPSDRIGVITFAGQPTVLSPVTLDRQILHQRVNAMDTAPGDTKLYDAINFAVSQLYQDAKKSRRTAIILMSDGLDGSIPGVQGGGSKLSYKDLLSRVQEFDGVLYTLWLNTEYEALSPLDTQPEAFDAGYDRMKEMAATGGGVFYEVERLEDLAGAYERVVADLGTVYSLAYRPADKTRDGKWRAIRVNVNRPSAVARGKRGYYAN